MYGTNKNIDTNHKLTLRQSNVRAINALEIENISLDINLLGIIGLIISNIIIILG